MKRNVGMLCCLAIAAALSTAALTADPLLSVSFAQGQWDPSAWVIAKNPTVEHLGQWVQREDSIENQTPDDPAKKSALDQSLTTMVYGKPFTGDYTVSSTLLIGPGAAPGIIIAQDWAPDAQGRPQYGEFYECIIYEKGINLWHHFAKDGKRTYEKWAWSNFALKPDTPYKFEVRKKGKSVSMTVDGRNLGVIIPSLPDELFLGVMGCEGVCRVFGFSVTR